MVPEDFAVVGPATESDVDWGDATTTNDVVGSVEDEVGFATSEGAAEEDREEFDETEAEGEAAEAEMEPEPALPDEPSIWPAGAVEGGGEPCDGSRSLPVPQGMASPLGSFALDGAVVAPEASEIANRPVQVAF